MVLAPGGDCLADVSSLRAVPEAYGPVASDPTISGLLTVLAGGVGACEREIGAARRAAQGMAWDLAEDHAPGHGATTRDPVVIDLDGTLVTARSEKEQAKPTLKKGLGSTRCWPPLTTAPLGAGRCSPACCGRATLARAPPPITPQ